jgi:hypothetical protein
MNTFLCLFGLFWLFNRSETIKLEFHHNVFRFELSANESIGCCQIEGFIQHKYFLKPVCDEPCKNNGVCYGTNHCLCYGYFGKYCTRRKYDVIIGDFMNHFLVSQNVTLDLGASIVKMIADAKSVILLQGNVSGFGKVC